MEFQHITVTVYCTILQDDRQRLVLKLKKPEDKRKVKWEEGTVDNEHMNKKKSKCKSISGISILYRVDTA